MFMNMIKLDKIKNNYPVILLFILTFAIYLGTLMPGIGYSGDVAKFQFTGKILGIPHTPGYPAYTLISHLFYLIPAGSPAYRINLMSAFFASLTAVFLFFVILRLTRNKPVSFISALLFSVSRTFWSQAVVAEVYTLNAFFITAVVLYLLIWDEKKDIKYFFLACFTFAMSFGHHLSMVLLVPAVVIFILVSNYRVLLKPVNLLICAGFFVLAALQYSYVFIRTYNPSAYVEMWVYNFEDFMWWITGGQFKGRMFSYTFGEFFLDRIPYYILKLKNQFHVIGMVIGLAGACLMIRDRLKQVSLLMLIYFGNLFFSLNYGVGDVYVFFIPSYIMFAVFIAAGLDAAYRKLAAVKNLDKRLREGVFIALSLLLFFRVYAGNYPVVNQSDNVWTDKFVDIILDNVESNSVILTPGYDWGQFYLYKLIGEQKRKGDDIKAHWYWHPSVIHEAYPSFALKPSINRAAEKNFKESFANRDATIRSPFMFNKNIPVNKSLYFHRGSRRIMDRAGFSSKKAISIFKYGHKTVVYKMIPEGGKDAMKCVYLHAPDEELKPSRRVRKRIDSFHRKGCIKIDFNRENRIFLKGGWSRNEISDGNFPYCWANDIESVISIPVKEPGDYEMELKAHSIDYKGAPEQWIKIYVNGSYVSKVTVSGVWDIYTVEIPAKYWREGRNAVLFRYNYLASPVEVFDQGDPRDISVAFAYLKLK